MYFLLKYPPISPSPMTTCHSPPNIFSSDSLISTIKHQHTNSLKMDIRDVVNNSSNFIQHNNPHLLWHFNAFDCEPFAKHLTIWIWKYKFDSTIILILLLISIVPSLWIITQIFLTEDKLILLTYPSNSVCEIWDN